MVMDKVREIAASMDTRNAQDKADVFAVSGAKAIQANSGLPVTNLGNDPVAIMRQVG